MSTIYCPVCYCQIFFYSKAIFSNAKIDKAYVPYAVIGTNAVNVVMTLIAVCSTSLHSHAI